MLPVTPFKVLDAPGLKDDYYCSVLAYSESCRTLAVGLGNALYAWTERSAASVLHQGNPRDGTYVTSIEFSSTSGRRSILAFGRSDRSLTLLSLYDSTLPRIEVEMAYAVACLSWRPRCTIRPSRNPYTPGVPVETEDLLVGDEAGNIYYYVVEWPAS